MKELSLFCFEKKEWDRRAFLKPFKSYHEEDVGGTDSVLLSSVKTALLSRLENIFLKVFSNSTYKKIVYAYIQNFYTGYIYLYWMESKSP